MPVLELVSLKYLLLGGWADLRASVDIWEIAVSSHCLRILCSLYDSNLVPLISTAFSEESFMCCTESVCLV
jgi:hypothetical protein